MAEIPPNVNDTQRELLLTVQRCMMHGPCGARNRSVPCVQDDGSCKNGFPKHFNETTVLRSDAYPEYRRRDNGIGFPKGQCFMDNRDVVPYSPPLLKKYNAHLNVEVVSNIRLVKYIFKYAYKGHDRAHVELGQRADEIQQHIDARYLGAAEAVWRLFEFPIHGASHSVERLSVHLPGQQLVHLKLVWRQPRLQAPRATSTTLTAWFALNTSLQAGAADPHGILRTLYQDVPLVCVFGIVSEDVGPLGNKTSALSPCLVACPPYPLLPASNTTFTCCFYPSLAQLASRICDYSWCPLPNISKCCSGRRTL